MNKQLKVLHVTNAFPNAKNTSKGIFIKSQIESLQKINIQVKIFVIDGIESKVNYFKAFFQLRRIIKEEKFDLIHAHHVFCGIIVYFSSKCPTIVSFLGSDVKEKFKNKLVNWLVRKDLKFIFKSKVMLKSVRISEEKYKIIPNGLNLSLFPVTPKADARQKLGLDLNKFYILFISAVSIHRPVKRYKLAEESVKYFKEKYNKNIEIHAFSDIPQDKLYLYYNAYDCFLLTSVSEGSPNAVKEAIFCNLPIISVDVGDVKERIRNLENSFIVKDNSYDISEAINEVMKNNSRSNGRETIQSLDEVVIAKNIYKYYLETIESF